MVFTSTRDGDLDLYTSNLDGSNVKRVTDAPGYDGGAFFSNDGSKIVQRSAFPKDEAAAQANVERWIGQFKNADGSPLTGVKSIKRKVAGFDITQVEVAGTFVGGMGAGAAGAEEPGKRMVATIVDAPKGPYYFKFLGDDPVVTANRKAFDDHLDKSIQLFVEEGKPFCVVIGDIDHFKNINDEYGHECGDQVLVAKKVVDVLL